MFVAAVAFSLFACIDRGDPTSPASTGADAAVTIAVNLPVASLEVGHAVNVTATATNSAGQPVSLDSVEWSSSDTSVLSVSKAGQVTARRMGNGAVYARWHSHHGHHGVSVTDTVPAKIVVSPSHVAQHVGTQTHLTASIVTATGRALPGHNIRWTSTDARYAAVSSGGVVTSTAPGTARVIAQASHVADTVDVTVAATPIARLAVTPGTSSLTSGTALQFSARATDASGNTLTGRTVSWKSSNDGVATVSTSGVVSASKVGTATISATSEGTSASASIHVSSGHIATLALSPSSIGLAAGKSQQLTAAATDKAGNTVSSDGITWSSSNTSVATVSSTGVVVASHTGSATITATSHSVSGHASVVVAAGTVSSVAVSPTTLSLTTGGTGHMSASIKDALGNPLTGEAVAWSSSNTSIASVSSSGLVTALKAGSATITASAGSAHGSAGVTVAAGSASTVSVSPGSSSMVAGATEQLSARVTDVSGSSVSGSSVTWSTSNSSVVSVSSTGMVKAGKVGSATVTATSSGKSGTAAFSVSAGAINTVDLSPATGSIQQGKTMQFTASFDDAMGNPVAPSSIAWTTSSSSVASVSSSGLVTGVAVGNATITATASGKSKSAGITVTSATVTAPAPAPTPPPTTPPPTSTPTSTPVITACSDFPHSRVVSVATSAELHSALSGARPGDLIQLEDGTYGDGSEFRLLVGGSSSQRITVCGSANAVINAGSVSSRDGMHLSGANYVTLAGFTITNGLFGVWADHSVHLVLQGLTIHAIGQEGIEIVAFSKNALITGNRIYDTGRVVAEYGEGIYIGSANAKWAALTGGQPDATDSVVIENNNIGPDVRAEHIDAKEGTTGGIIRNNTFNGAGMVESQGSGISGWPNSWVILQGVGYHVENNTGSNALAAGFRVVTHGTVMTGLDNSFSNNSFDVSGAPYGFLIQTGSGSNGNGNVVGCSNSARNASVGLANVSCQ